MLQNDETSAKYLKMMDNNILKRKIEGTIVREKKEHIWMTWSNNL